MVQNKEKVMIAMKKAKTSLEKVMKMIEDDKYCIDIIQQNLAVIGLLKSANMGLLDGHVHCCIRGAYESGNKKEIDTKMAELINILKIAQTK